MENDRLSYSRKRKFGKIKVTKKMNNKNIYLILICVLKKYSRKLLEIEFYL